MVVLANLASVNYVSILAAAILGWLLGALYYGLLGSAWVRVQGKTSESFRAEMAVKSGTPAAWAPYLLSFVAEFVMAMVLSGIIHHVGTPTARRGMISAFLVWAGFVLTTTAVNNAFCGRRAMLTAIDAGHWLLVLLAMGAVLGWFGA